MRSGLGELGRGLHAIARGVHERDLEAAVGCHLDAAVHAAPCHGLAQRRESLGVVQHVDRLGIETGQRRETAEQPEPVPALRPEAQLGVGACGRPVDHAHRRRPERRAPAARAAFPHELPGIRHAGEQGRHALEQCERGEHARVERIGSTGDVLHRSEDTDRVGRQPSASPGSRQVCATARGRSAGRDC